MATTKTVKVKNITKKNLFFSSGVIEAGKTGDVTLAESITLGKYVERTDKAKEK